MSDPIADLLELWQGEKQSRMYWQERAETAEKYAEQELSAFAANIRQMVDSILPAMTTMRRERFRQRRKAG